jgi:hypothetical protein
MKKTMNYFVSGLCRKSGGGGGGGGAGKSAGGVVSTPSGATLKPVDKIGGGIVPEYVLETSPERITRQTEKAIMVEDRRGRGTWIPKSQLEGWYTGKDGNGKPGIKVNYRWAERQDMRGLKRHDAKTFEIK